MYPLFSDSSCSPRTTEEWGLFSASAQPKGGPYLGCGTKFTLRIFFFGIYAKNGYRNVSFICEFELFGSRYGRSPFM